MAIGNQMCIHDELSIPNKHKYKTSGPLYCKHTNVFGKRAEMGKYSLQNHALLQNKLFLRLKKNFNGHKNV